MSDKNKKINCRERFPGKKTGNTKSPANNSYDQIKTPKKGNVRERFPGKKKK